MSDILSTYIDTTGLAPALSPDEAERLAAQLTGLSDLAVYPGSLTAIEQTLLCLGKKNDEKFLLALTTEPSKTADFRGETQTVTVEGTNLSMTLGLASAQNAGALRQRLPFLRPTPLGLRKSAGCGDRLGLATPGHIRAIRQTPLAPIFAQQSIRENARTGRSPQQVLDEAMWGVFQEGWRGGFGADADHLKNSQDIDVCAAAGYTFYTIDPGEYVDDSANDASRSALEQKVAALPWHVLDSNPVDLDTRLAGNRFDLGQFRLTINAEDLMRAAAKYGQAVAHTVSLYRYLADGMAESAFELEMSVDETDTVTTLAEHIYIVTELKRLGVRWVSLAPRYVGRFEKGVDYIGDLDEFETSFAQHVAVAQAFGPYKLSLHSGSDKFSIYPIAAKLAGELVHLKTAGTSYLEALRAIAALDPDLFRAIVAFASERYPADRASYYVSAEVQRVPDVSKLPDDKLSNLLDDFHAREVLHVTYGSVLNHPDFREPFFTTLRRGETTYTDIVETHFNKHFRPFC